MKPDSAAIIKKYFSPGKILFYITLCGVYLRLMGIWNDLWLDEIWSFFLVSQLHSPLEIITKAFHENNHILNSFFIYFIGKGSAVYWFKFRLLSLAAGILTIPLAYLASIRLFPDKAWRFITTLLVALSFPLIFYSSEARGYASASFFGLLSFCALSEFLREDKPWLLYAFYCSFVLGFLAHLSFIYVSWGLFAISVYFQFREKASSAFRQKIAALCKIFLLPSILVILVYFRYVLHLISGRAFVLPLSETIRDVAAYLAGLPNNNPYSYAIAILVYIILIGEIFNLLKEKSIFGIFLASCAAGICLDILIRQPKYFYFRYFSSVYPFFVILLSCSLYRYRRWKIGVTVIILLILFGNMASYLNFIKNGRGRYLEALDYMCRHSGASPVTIGSTRDSPISMMLAFYGSFRPNEKILYIPREKEIFQPAEWFIMEELGRKLNPLFKPPYFLTVGYNIVYTFEKDFPYCGDLAGFTWLLYHRKPGNPLRKSPQNLPPPSIAPMILR